MVTKFKNGVRKLSVSKVMIQRGKQSEASYCPIAISAKKVFRTSYVSIYSGANMRIGDDGRYRGSTPIQVKRINKFIKAFDKGRYVRPQEFLVKPVD